MKRFGFVVLAVLVAALVVGCATGGGGGGPAAARAQAPIPEIVITGTHSASSGDIQFHGFADGAVVSAIAGDGSFTIIREAGASIQLPDWDAGNPGGSFPFIGNSVDAGTGDYTITGIYIGGVDIRELLGVTDWAGVLAHQSTSARAVTLTPTANGIEVTGRGNGQWDNNNGLRLNVAMLANLFADRPADAQPVAVVVEVEDVDYDEDAEEQYE